MLNGKHGLICNVANQRSVAWAIAKACDAYGARIAIGYLGERELKQLEKLVEELEQTPLLVHCDVTDEACLAALRETLQAEFGRLDFLSHAIAYANLEDLRGRFTDVSREGFLLAQDVSAYSLTALTRTVEPLFTEGGSVSTLSYIGAVRAVPNYNVMGVAKASLEASVRYLASELGPANIRVNAISAGPIRTLAAMGIAGFRDMYKSFAEMSPMRENITIEDCGNAAVYLCSDMAAHVTGEIQYVDSGYNIMALEPVKSSEA